MNKSFLYYLKRLYLPLLLLLVFGFIVDTPARSQSEIADLTTTKVMQNLSSDFWQMKFDATGLAPTGILGTHDGGFWVYGNHKEKTALFSLRVDQYGNQQSFYTYDIAPYNTDFQINGETVGAIVGDEHVLGITLRDNNQFASKVWLLKIDKQGNLKENLIFPTEESIHFINGLTVSHDGNFLLGGRKGNEAWIAKASTDLEFLWEKTYSSPSFNSAEGPNYSFSAIDIVETADNGIMLLSAFSNEQLGVREEAIWLLKLNENGEFDSSQATWEKLYGYQSSTSSLAMAMSPTNDGGIVVAGTNQEYGISTSQRWLMKVKADGSIAWENVYGGIPTSSLSNSSIRNVITVNDGYIVTGVESSSSGFITKLNEDGRPVWHRSAGYRYFYGNLAVLSDGNFGFLGFHASISGTESYFELMKIDPTGERPGCSLFTKSELPAVTATNVAEINRASSVQIRLAKTDGISTELLERQEHSLTPFSRCNEGAVTIVGPENGNTLLIGETLTFYTNVPVFEGEMGVKVDRTQLQAYFNGAWNVVGTDSRNYPHELEVTIQPEWVDPQTNSVKFRLKAILENNYTQYISAPSNYVEYAVTNEQGKNLNVRYADQVFIQRQLERGYWNRCGPTSTAMMLHHLGAINGDVLYDPSLTETLSGSILAPNDDGYRISWPNNIKATIVNSEVLAAYKPDNKITFDLLKTSIDRGYPVILSLKDANHIVLVTGYRGDDTLIINDPYGEYQWWTRTDCNAYPNCLNAPPSSAPMFKGYHVSYTFSATGNELYAIFAEAGLPEPDSATNILEEGLATVRTDNVSALIQTNSNRSIAQQDILSTTSFTVAERHSTMQPSSQNSIELTVFDISSSVTEAELVDLKIDLTIDVDVSLLESWLPFSGFSDPNVVIESTNRVYFAYLDPISNNWVEISSELSIDQNELSASVSMLGEYAVFIESISTSITVADAPNKIYIPFIVRN